MVRSAWAWIRSITSSRRTGLNRCANRFCARRYGSTGSRCLIGVADTTSPRSASYTGNNPLWVADRANLTAWSEPVPQPRGQGTSTCR